MYIKPSLSGYICYPPRVEILKEGLEIKDEGSIDHKVVKSKISTVWFALGKVQRDAKNTRDKHMAILVEHYGQQRNTT